MKPSDPISTDQLSAIRQRLSGVQHVRTGPGRCACGFNAYSFSGIMLDYHEMLMTHLAANRGSAPVLTLDDARALLAEVDRLSSP